jgi:hypothetical protein
LRPCVCGSLLTLPPTPSTYLIPSPPTFSLQRAVRSSLVAATAGTALMACFLMGVFANLPLAVAPGMGINGESAPPAAASCLMPAAALCCTSARQLSRCSPVD